MIFISFLRAVDGLHNGVCSERMLESVWCYLLISRWGKKESISVFVCNKPTLDEVL